jgi:hypothetical protein
LPRTSLGSYQQRQAEASADSLSRVADPTEQEAINVYLTPVEDTDDGRFSLLDALLRDANQAMQAGALWLGASGFLIAIEQLGKTIQDRGTNAQRGGSEISFRAALIDFAPGLEDPTAGALYALRCALVHSFGLTNPSSDADKQHVFALTRSGPPVRFPETDWDGSIEGTGSLEMTTIVNIEALRDLVEGCLTHARQLNDAGDLVLVPNMHPERLFAERIMRIVPDDQVHAQPTHPSTGASVTGTA